MMLANLLKSQLRKLSSISQKKVGDKPTLIQVIVNDITNDIPKDISAAKMTV